MRNICQGLLGLGIAFHFGAAAATFTVSNTNEVGSGSLRQAILDANANEGADAVAFNISGAGLRTIPENSVDLSVGQATDADLVGVGSNVTFHVTLFNTGPATATGVVLTNPVPFGATFVSASTSQGACAHAAGLVSCALGTLAEGVVIEVAVTLKTSTAGSLTNVVGVMANEVERVPQDNVSRLSMPIGYAQLAVALLPSAETLTAGQILTNLVVVTNRGPDTAYRVSAYVSAENFFVPLAVECGGCQISAFFDLQLEWPALASGESRTATLVLFTTNVGVFLTEASLGAQTPIAPGEDIRSRIVTIVEPGPGLVSFQESNLSVREGVGILHAVVRRQAGSVGPISVSYAAVSRTAEAGQDFVPGDGVLTFADGESEKSIEIPILSDERIECREEFELRLLQASGGARLYGATNLAASIIEQHLMPIGLVSAASVSSVEPGATAGSWSESASGSADGRFLAFVSYAGDLTADYDVAASQPGNIFVRDLVNGTTVLASPVAGTSNVGAGDCVGPSMSADGRYVAFTSGAQTMVGQPHNVGDGNNVYLRDLVAGTTSLISVSRDGSGGASGYANSPIVSSNGAVVLFGAVASNLVDVPVATDSKLQLYVRSVTNQTTSLVSINHDGTSGSDGWIYDGVLSVDGRYVAFVSDAGDLTPNDTNGLRDVFLRDTWTGITTLVSVNAAGTGSANDVSYRLGGVSADGRWVTFQSIATDLVPGSPVSSPNVYIRDLATGTTRVAGVLPPVLAGSYFGTAESQMTPNGRYVVFESRRFDPPWYMTFQIDVFVRDLETETTTLVSANCHGTGGANGSSERPRISDDGRYVVFESRATDLVPGEVPSNVMSFYRRDLVAGTTGLLSQNHALTQGTEGYTTFAWMSGDGKVVAFDSDADDLVTGDNNGSRDVFVWREGLPPRLFAHLTNGVVTLTWASSPPGFVLEENVGLENALSWRPYEGPVVSMGTIWMAVVPYLEGAEQRFFRLRRP